MHYVRRIAVETLCDIQRIILMARVNFLLYMLLTLACIYLSSAKKDALQRVGVRYKQNYNCHYQLLEKR